MTRFYVSVADMQALAAQYCAAAKASGADPAVAAGAALALWFGINVKHPDADAMTAYISRGSDALLSILHPGVGDATQPFADRWQYVGGDSCCQFFTTCLKAARYDLLSGSRVLEVGCAEFDWMGEMLRQCPDIHVTGIDWRKTERGIQGDVLTYDFPEGYFDACVAISSLEHMGLGHYNQDPVDAEGDSHALSRIWRWLKPGGLLYLDVPYHPDRYAVQGTSHREYDERAIEERLFKPRWRELWRGWCQENACSDLILEKPTEKPRGSFYYVGVVWQKV